MLKLNVSGHVQMEWPDGTTTSVTVNVFNSGGGTSTGGTSDTATINDLKPSGSSDNSAVIANLANQVSILERKLSDGPDHAAIIANLTIQLANLSQKVEQLSSVRRTIVDTGIWNTKSVRPLKPPWPDTEGRVNFSKQFSLAPTVMVSISGADVANQHNFRVIVSAKNIDWKGFTIHVHSWAGSETYSCGVSWIAVGN
ncbi:hypothetical protein PT974_04845 [Cladobotryum mycophilum]|uniref:H-type lectin domain-containing protein n=1 Tax=Cladobotryum mycophilum TaxID=491253 RepID=A0ABR0SRM5_9HYPO